jgi:hypothetical protein
MNQFSKTSKKEKKLKTRCLRYKKGKCVSKYTRKQIKLLQSLQKEFKDYKKRETKKDT